MKPTTKPVSILGINSVYHESSACLIQDGRLVAVAEEERFNRIKHGKPAKVDNADELPEQAIAFCLRSGGLGSIADVDFIGYTFEPEDRSRKTVPISIATAYRSGAYQRSCPLEVQALSN